MTDTQAPPVLVTQDGAVRTLTLNRPHRRNALNADMVDALDAELSAAECDSDTHAVVLAGNGKSFCAGADLQYFVSLHNRFGSPISFLRRVSALVTRLETSPLPVVAALHGHAVAGGLELALGCDVVVAEESTLIGDGHIRNNLLPAGGSSVRLPRKVGESMARWLSLTGELVTPDRLAATGWIHQIVTAAELSESVMAVASVLARHHGAAQAAFKKLLFDLTATDPRNALSAELDAFDAHWGSTDVLASLVAFLGRNTSQATSTTSGGHR